MKQEKKVFIRTEIDFAKKMKEIGIHLASLPEYKTAEQYAKTIQKTSVQRHTQVAFTASL